MATPTAKPTTVAPQAQAPKHGSVLVEYMLSVKSMTTDIETAVAGVGGDLARNKAQEAIAELKKASEHLENAVLLDK